MAKHLVFAVINDLTYDQRMIRICTSLATAGFQVTLIGRKLSSSISISEQPFNQYRIKCWFSEGPFFYLEYNLRLFFQLLRSHYDVFAACDLDTALAIHYAGKIKGRLRIFDAHEYFTEVPEVMNRPIVKKTWEWVGKSTTPHFDLRYTVNQALAEKLGELYGVEFKVIHNFPVLNQPQPIVDKKAPGNQEPERSGEQRIILYQGALNAGRGIEQMISAMPFIPGATFWIVGEGDLSDQLRGIVKSKKLTERVIFLGRKSPKELRDITPKADLGVNLLNGNSLNYYYSLANKFFDYMHAGVPSINMDFPSYKVVLQRYDVGICISSLEPQVIANAVNNIFSTPKKLETMSQSCMEAREVYQWKTESTKLIHMVKNLLSM